MTSPDFVALPDAPRFRLSDLRAPGCLVEVAGVPTPDGLVMVDLDIADGRIVGVGASGALAETDAPVVACRGGLVFPAFVDMHTHLDKGHIWARSPNPDGSFMGALTTVSADRIASWSSEDVRRRADFSLRCAYAHGTRAVRTHLDSIDPQPEISWPVFEALRDAWAGRIDLQAVCLLGVDRVDDTPSFRALADRVAASGGVLGAVAYPVADLDRRLDVFFRLAAERGLAADLHVDETLDPTSDALDSIAEAVRRNRFEAPVTVGHCCSLSTQTPEAALATIDKLAETGISVVSLPLCNLYLQDRNAADAPPRTPRYRGVTLVHEMVARGVPVAFASDNTRDPFYAYGDLDMVEVMREATRIAHLDHSRGDWPRAFSATPAAICGFAPATIVEGAPADLVIARARSWTEFYARPQTDRVVLRAGRAIDRSLPDYAELDDLMGPDWMETS